MKNGVKGTSLLTLTHMDTGVKFYHLSDERAFFEWLTRIPCVQSCEGDGNRGLVVRLKRRPGKDDLRQLVALCRRYGVDMKQLGKFETAKNRVWFRDPQTPWYRAVFGKTSARQ
jgi:hypothetical protein